MAQPIRFRPTNGRATFRPTNVVAVRGSGPGNATWVDFDVAPATTSVFEGG